MRILETALPMILLFASVAHATAVPESVVSACTTAEPTYHVTAIRAPALSEPEKRDAVHRALGSATSNPDFVAHTFNGQWFFEHETGDAVYVGYKVRTHYLSAAIVLTDEGVSTLICNSSNMDQKPRSIHRKAPLWKGTLDGNLRVELGRAAAERSQRSRIRQSLMMLHDHEIISGREFEELEARLESARPSD